MASAGNGGQQAVHRRHAGRGPGRPLGRPDAGPERGGLPARHHGAGGDRRHVRQHGDRRVGSDRRRLQRRRGLRGRRRLPGHRPRTPAPGIPDRQDRPDRSRRLLHQRRRSDGATKAGAVGGPARPRRSRATRSASPRRGRPPIVPTMVIQQSSASPSRPAGPSGDGPRHRLERDSIALVGEPGRLVLARPDRRQHDQAGDRRPGRLRLRRQRQRHGTEAFGGTSGAAPMVTGAAALLREQVPGRSRPRRSRPCS